MSRTLDACSVQETRDEIIEFLSGCRYRNLPDPERVGEIYRKAMLYYALQLGPDTESTLTCRKNTALLRISLTVPGKALNPLTDVQGDYTGEYSADINNGVQWSYRDGVNYLMWSCKLTGGVSPIQQVVYALAAAILLGLLCRRFLPENTVRFLNEEIAGRLFGLFMRILGCVAGPLIFLSIVNGIYSIGDSASFDRIGKTLIYRYLVMLAVIGLVCTGLLTAVYGISPGSGTSGSSGYLVDMILNIVPSDFFSPFIEGNTLQIIFLAFIIGITMMYLGSRTSVVSQIVEQSQRIVSSVMKSVGDMIYIFVFLSIFRIVVGGQLGEVLHSYKLLLITMAYFAAVMAFYFLYVSVKFKISPRRLAGKISRPFVVALTTSSSSAALSDSIEVCERELGISHRLAGFGVPLGHVMYSVGPVLNYIVFGFCIAKGFGTPVTFHYIVTLWFVSVILSIATPPVAGSAATCFAVLVSQLGLPTEAVAICISLGALLEYPGTAIKVACVELELLRVAQKTGELDEDVLTDSSKQPEVRK